MILKEAELELVKDENQLLISALRRAPIELMRSGDSIEEMKTLIGSAAGQQEIIDYIDNQLRVKSED